MKDARERPVPLPSQTLDDIVKWYVAHGWRIESRADDTIAMVKGHRITHLLHLILTLLTFGLWGVFVWMPLTVFGGERRYVITPADVGRYSLL